MSTLSKVDNVALPWILAEAASEVYDVRPLPPYIVSSAVCCTIFKLFRYSIGLGGGAMGAYAPPPPPRQAKMVRVVEYL